MNIQIVRKTPKGIPPPIPYSNVFSEMYAAELGKYRYRVLHGGRGSGKSHVMADALVIKAYLKPLRILCCREIQKSIAESSKKLIEDKMKARGLIGPGRPFQSTEYSIRGRGSEFLFAGLRTNPDAIKSMEGLDVAWIEEANRASDKSITILRPTLRNEQSEIWASYNPEKPDDAIDKMFRGGEPPPRSLIIEANWRDNPFFPKVLRDEMDWDRRRDPDRFGWIWEGEYIQHSHARVFTNWTEGEIVVPPGTRPYYGADWGFSVDPTVLIKVYLIPGTRTLYVEKELYRVGLEIDHTPAFFKTMDPDITKWPICSDSARPETISYMKRHDFPKMMGAKKGAGSVEDGIEFMKSFDIVINPSCQYTIREFKTFQWKTDPQDEKIILPVLGDKDNHLIDAVRYAVESTRRGRYGMMDVL